MPVFLANLDDGPCHCQKALFLGYHSGPLPRPRNPEGQGPLPGTSSRGLPPVRPDGHPSWALPAAYQALEIFPFFPSQPDWVVQLVDVHIFSSSFGVPGVLCVDTGNLPQRARRARSFFGWGWFGPGDSVLSVLRWALDPRCGEDDEGALRRG